MYKYIHMKFLKTSCVPGIAPVDPQGFQGTYPCFGTPHGALSVTLSPALFLAAMLRTGVREPTQTAWEATVQNAEARRLRTFKGGYIGLRRG